MPVDVTALKAALSGRYLKAEDLDGDLTLTIDDANLETVGQETGDKKLVISFKDSEQVLPLNKTNLKAIQSVLEEDDPNKWIGKAVTFYPTKVQFKDEVVAAIRVRLESF